MFSTRGFAFVLFTFTFCGYSQGNVDISDARNLQTYLFANYTPEHRPLYNQSERVKLTATFYLLDITEFDDIRQQFICNGMLNVTWKDEFLVWNASEFGGLDQFSFVETPKAWFPRLEVINTLDKRNVFQDETHLMTVQADGTITMYPAAIFKTSCPMDVHLFPMDQQTCEILFLPSHYYATEVELSAGNDVVNLERFRENGQWDVVKTSFQVQQQSEICKWVIALNINRRPLFFFLNAVVPVMILSFLNMVTFAIPAESGEKLSYTVTMFLALVVYMTSISDLIPNSSLNSAMLTGYITTVIGVSAINVMATIFVLRFFHMSEDKEVPAKLQWVVKRLHVLIKRESGEVMDVTWKDVAKTLDYIFLRLSVAIIVLYTFSFLIAVVAKSS